MGRVKKSGMAPVYVQVWLERERVLFNCQVEIEPKSFDPAKCCIKGKSPEARDNNTIIESVRARITEIAVKYRLQNKNLTSHLLKQEYSNPSLDIDFIKWMENEIRIRKNDVSDRRTIKYKTVFNKIGLYAPKLRFSEIDHFWIEGFRGWLKKVRKNDINTVSSNLSVLKSFCNRALKKELLKIDPFADIRIGRSPGDRVYCSEKELRLLWDLYIKQDFTDTPHLKTVLRHFLFMCFTGLRISDFLALDYENMVGNTICFCPIKTSRQKKQMVRVPLGTAAVKLIADEGTIEGLIFRPLSEQRMNKNLKEIAKMAGINKPLTNHSGRHTFATLFIEKTSDVATLQKLLGHSRVEETMVYVHISESKIKAQMKIFDQELNWTE